MTDSSKERVVLAYDAVAPLYDRWAWQRFWDENERPRVVALAGAPSGRALDLGTGTGRYLQGLTASRWATVGVDVSLGMLAVAAHAPIKAMLVRADARALPFADGQFSLAVAARVLCHLDSVDAAISELTRVVTRQGSLIVTELDPEHDFETTCVPTPQGGVAIPTWKRDSHDLVRAAEASGWQLRETVRLRSTDCSWLPSDGLSSIDRSGKRAISYIVCLTRR